MNNFSTELNRDSPCLETMHTLNNQASANLKVPTKINFGFEEAGNVLDYATAYDGPSQNAAVTLETSRALRTRGLLAYIGKYRTHARIPSGDFDPVQELLRSKSMTEGLLGLVEDQSARGMAKSLAEVKKPTLRTNTREIMANHALTLSYLARIATREQVLRGEINTSKRLSDVERAAITARQRYYGRDYAHGFAVLGNVPDVIVENAMYGARAEVLMGGFTSKLRAGVWLGRAAMGVIRSVLHADWRSTRSTVKQALTLAPALRSRSKAIMATRKDV